MAGCQNYCVQIDTGSTGSFVMTGVDMEANNYAMQILSANEVVMLTGGNVITSAVQTVPINIPSPTNNVFISPDNVLGDPVANAGRTIMSGNASAPVITISGANLSLPPVGNVFNVATGGSASSIFGEWYGRTITLVFAGTTTIQNTTGAGSLFSVQLAGSTDFVSTANSTLTLTSIGNNKGWFEVSHMKP